MPLFSRQHTWLYILFISIGAFFYLGAAALGSWMAAMGFNNRPNVDPVMAGFGLAIVATVFLVSIANIVLLALCVKLPQQ